MGQLEATRASFASGALAKPDYIEAMHAFHALLFEYADFLSGSDVAKIEIAAGRVVMTSRQGLRFVCSGEDRRAAPIEALNFGRYEEADAELFYRSVRAGAVVFDIGANIGWHALHIAAAAPDVEVYAFEPLPPTFAWLERNIALNGISNVRAFNFGLSDHEGTVPFYYCPEGATAASAADLLGRPGTRQIDCAVRRLDDVVDEIGRAPDLIKCDVEGGELFVFQGATRCLQEHRPLVFCEMLRKWAARLGYHPNQTIALFESLGYRCYEAVGGKLRRLARVDDATTATNFFFLHPARHGEASGDYRLP